MVKPEHFPNLHGMDYFGWLGWTCYSVVWTNHFKSQAEKQVSDLHLQMFLNNLANMESTTFDVDKDFILHPSECSRFQLPYFPQAKVETTACNHANLRGPPPNATPLRNNAHIPLLHCFRRDHLHRPLAIDLR